MPMSPEGYTFWGSIALSVIAIVSNAVGFAMTWAKDKRAHDWATDERNRQTRSVVNKVEETAVAAVTAYTAANSVNEKIADLNRRLLEVVPKNKRMNRRLSDRG